MSMLLVGPAAVHGICLLSLFLSTSNSPCYSSHSSSHSFFLAPPLTPLSRVQEDMAEQQLKEAVLAYTLLYLNIDDEMTQVTQGGEGGPEQIREGHARTWVVLGCVVGILVY